MPESIYLRCEQYELKGALSDNLFEDDLIFASDKGIFINRGTLLETNLDCAQEILANLDKTGIVTTIKPFVIFGIDFKKNTDQTIIPQESIHIDNRNFVTHYYFSFDQDFPNPIEKSDNNQYPHHLELISKETKEQFGEKIQIALKYIENDDISKVVLARQLQVISDININKRLLFLELFDSQPNCYVYSINNFVGASPELLIEKFGDTTKLLPMAGTRKRHARVDDDDQDLADLRTNKKDIFEHKVVIENIVNKLNQISNNVFYSSNPSVIKLPHVAHLATSISAIIDDKMSLIDLIDIIHPTPAVAGVPTAKALEVIDELEDFDRELYAAPIGWIDSDLNGQSAIALRCAKVENKVATLFAGVGIVDGSDTNKEWEETKAKFGVIRDALMNITQ